MAEPESPPLPTVDHTKSAPGPSVPPDPVADAVEDVPKALSNKPCAGCKSTGERNLVVCIDGTSNQFSTKNTNVVELYSRLKKDDNQLTFYNSGIGTYAKPSWKSWSYRKQVIANKLDLAFALRFEKIILSAYAWLVDNYRPGDRIFLFGFSRGAYQVRALAAMIEVVGLLYKGNNDQIPFAYELYAASDDQSQPSDTAMKESALKRLSLAISGRMKRGPQTTSEPSPADVSEQTNEAPISMQAQFKETFSRPNVRTHFVGAWDTVSSVGFIRDKTLPKTTDGMKSTCFFRHALALHEYRVKFLPEYVNGSRGPDPEHHREGTEPHVKEVWFEGSHSDIGGGSTANTALDQFGPALRWISHEGELAGLRITERRRRWVRIEVSKSMTFVWRIVEHFPIKRLSYEHWDRYLNQDDVRFRPLINALSSKFETTWRPHRRAHREIQPGQGIYRSVNREHVAFKLPKFLWTEEDAYMEANIVLRPVSEALRLGCILDDRNSALFDLLIVSVDGIRSLQQLDIINYIYDMSQSCRKTQAAQQIFRDLQRLHVAYVEGLLRFNRPFDMPRSDVTKTTSSATFPFHMCGHKKTVSTVAFLSNRRVVSGSWDETLRIWDVGTGEMTLGSPLRGHTDDIRCVAVHAAKGLVASACDDSTIRLWTSDSNGAVHAGKVLRDEGSGLVLAVAFSPDGSHLVSGSGDGAIRVWDAATGGRVGAPVHGHTDWVWSVAFSSDGKRVVSGSDDCTVRLWDWSTGEAALQPCGEPLKGHTDEVYSVALSPDAGVIASGSEDQTVRIWDVATRTPKFTLEAHTNAVYSVAFAPSGTHVVSGSDDWTVRIWDARTGTAVRVLRAHTGGVNPIAFSPDGTRIASGSRDNTVRVWDFVPPPDKSHPDEDVQAAAPAQIEPAQRR